MSRIPARVFFALALCVSICTATAAEREHPLRQGDALLITIDNPIELHKLAYVISDSGEIECPLLGRLYAAGKTPSELAKSIRDALLKDFYRKVDVTVGKIRGHFAGVYGGPRFFIPEGSHQRFIISEKPGHSAPVGDGNLTPNDKIKIFKITSFEVHLESKQ
jgi:hypothetical protein